MLKRSLSNRRAKTCLKMKRQTIVETDFSNYYNRSFSNIITGNEAWVHFNEHKRKIQIKMKIPAFRKIKVFALKNRTHHERLKHNHVIF